MRKVSFYYFHSDGRCETLASATTGDRQAIMEAERSAKRKALDIQAGHVIVGSVREMIGRFKCDIAPTHYADQSKDGLAVRAGTYVKLIKFFWQYVADVTEKQYTATNIWMIGPKRGRQPRRTRNCR
ncbi:hypothetical protein ACFS07_10160 [Undibacterium arcticum]